MFLVLKQYNVYSMCMSPMRLCLSAIGLVTEVGMSNLRPPCFGPPFLEAPLTHLATRTRACAFIKPNHNASTEALAVHHIYPE